MQAARKTVGGERPTSQLTTASSPNSPLKRLQGARWALRTLFGRDLDAELDQWVYVGDSTNDQLMFEHLPHSVGVANIEDFADQLSHPPRYVTQGARGQGFAELVQHLLKA